MLSMLLIFSSASCGGENKEKLLENAIDVTTLDIERENKSNFLAAQSKYEGKVLKLTGQVIKFSEKYITLNGMIDVYLPKNELDNEIKNLQKDQVITVVGTMDNFKQGKKEMKNANFVSDVIEISGTIEKVTNFSHNYNAITKNYQGTTTENYIRILVPRPTDDKIDHYYISNIIPTETSEYNGIKLKNGDNVKISGKFINYFMKENLPQNFDGLMYEATEITSLEVLPSN